MALSLTHFLSAGLEFDSSQILIAINCNAMNMFSNVCTCTLCNALVRFKMMQTIYCINIQNSDRMYTYTCHA